MVRVKSSVTGLRRRKKVLKQAKGQFGQKSKRYKQAKPSVTKGMVYAYRDRRVKKREIKNLWIIRINAACQENGITYSRFIKGLKAANIVINRKVLADLAAQSTSAFKKLVKVSQEALTA
ncbi:MAG: 50S ribosomal protein L20 [Candidatus Omnitrophota bacterium]